MQTKGDSTQSVTKALLDFGQTIDPKDLFPVVVPTAQGFALRNPYAFAMATCLDRGTKAEIIWTIPYDMCTELGHLDPNVIGALAEGELMTLFAKLPRRPRYINDAPRTVKELTEIVVRKCGGNASLIWHGKRALEVKRTFRSIHGVGPGIANMAVLLIEKAFGERFDDLDRPHMDIKPDVHTKRVLYRLGSARSQSEQDAVEVARRLNPAYPGELDGALWMIGRRWCHATAPQCYLCPISTGCMKVDEQ